MSQAPRLTSRACSTGDGNGYIGLIIKTEDSKLYVDNIGRIYEGMAVDIRSNTMVVEGGENVTVASVDYANGCITLSQTVSGTLVGKFVYIHGAYGNEITGFKALFGTDDIYGLSREGEGYLTPSTFNVTSINEAEIAEKISFLEQYYNSRPNMILCSYKTRAAIAAALRNRACRSTLPCCRAVIPPFCSTASPWLRTGTARTTTYISSTPTTSA